MIFKTRFLFLLFILVKWNIGSAQSGKNIKLTFQAAIGNSTLDLMNSNYKLSNGDSIQIETLKFYVSAVELLNEDKSVWKENKSFHLIDVQDKKTAELPLNLPVNISFSHIKFNLGVDSSTNVSGAMGGDLDPTRGMYWTWQSGYINFKLEGRSKHCKTRNNEFQFHLGGYQYPFNSLQTVILNVREQQEINIVLDIDKLISGLNLEKQNHIMSPCNEAVILSKNLSKNFSAK